MRDEELRQARESGVREGRRALLLAIKDIVLVIIAIVSACISLYGAFHE